MSEKRELFGFPIQQSDAVPEGYVAIVPGERPGETMEERVACGQLVKVDEGSLHEALNVSYYELPARSCILDATVKRLQRFIDTELSGTQNGWRTPIIVEADVEVVPPEMPDALAHLLEWVPRPRAMVGKGRYVEERCMGDEGDTVKVEPIGQSPHRDTCPRRTDPEATCVCGGVR